MHGVLSLRSLERSFGGVRVLRNLSFEVPAGEIFGFLGPNGAGKTTTMRAIFGLVGLDSGEVRFSDRVVGRQDRLRFGYMPEERGLYQKMTVWLQLRYLGRLHGIEKAETERRIRYWLERFDLTESKDKRIESLSLGNQQRVQLIAAMIHEPELLVLDEPFSGLDPVATQSMVEVMREIVSAGRTLLFSSHQLDLVESMCDSVAIIRDGSLIAEGRVADLTRGDGFELSVRIDGVSDQRWPSSVPGVASFSFVDDTYRIRLNSTEASNQVLQAALSAGVVKEFKFDRITLSQVFMRAVGTASEVGSTA